jgi:hypothetical protein
MRGIGRVSAFVIVGLLVINVIVGSLQAMIPQRAGRGEAFKAEPLRSSSLDGSWTVFDASRALSASVKFFGNRIFLDVEVRRLVHTKKEVRLELVVTPRTVEGYVPLHMDRLAVDGGKTAIVTSDGAWFHIRDARGVGLLQAIEMLRSSPVYAIGAPRRVELIFPVPVPSVSRAILLVRWAPGKSATYAESWRTDRSVEVDLVASH